MAAVRTIIKFSRKFSKEELQQQSERFEAVYEPLLELLDACSVDCLFLPIEAFTTLSKINEEIVAQMTPKVTPRLLRIFRLHHSEGTLGSELIRLFKLWCNYAQCRQIFVDTFIPFIMDIVAQYYKQTPNAENRDA